MKPSKTVQVNKKNTQSKTINKNKFKTNLNKKSAKQQKSENQHT